MNVLVAIALLPRTLDLKSLAVLPPKAMVVRWGKPDATLSTETWWLIGNLSDTPAFRQASAFRKSSKPKGWHQSLTYRWPGNASLGRDGIAQATAQVTDGKIESIQVEAVPLPGKTDDVRAQLYRSLGFQGSEQSPEKSSQSDFPPEAESGTPQIEFYEYTASTQRSKNPGDAPFSHLRVTVNLPSPKRPPSLPYAKSFYCSVGFGMGQSPATISYTLPLSNTSLQTLVRVGLQRSDLLDVSDPDAKGTIDSYKVLFDRRWRVEWQPATTDPGPVSPAFPGFATPDFCSLAFEKQVSGASRRK